MTSDALEGTADEGRDGAAGDGEDEDVALAKQAATVFQLILKGIKNINIYRHAEQRFAEFMEPAHRALTEFLELAEVLALKLGPYTLEYKKQVIYEDQDKENLTYRFYRDGMRFLMFRHGLPLEELVRFVLLASQQHSDSALFQEDMITRLWKEEFTCIEYVVMEGFGFGDMSEEEVEVEVDKIIGYLRKQLAAKSDDVTRFARLSADDLSLQLTDVEQVRGGIISGRTATPEDHSAIQEELFTEDKHRLFAKMVLILFQILQHECGAEDYEMMAEALTQVLDTLVLTEDVKGSVALMHRLETVARQSEGTERHDLFSRLRDTLHRRMIEPQRLDAVGRYVSLSRKLDEGAVKAYFGMCGENELIQLTDMLSTMERQEGRRILIQVLSELGKDHAEIFARRLDNSASNVVRDMLAIIFRIDPPDKLKMFARCLEHPNIMIRLEGLKIMAKAPEDAALKYIEQAMQDSDMQLRLGAYRALAQRSPARATAALSKLISNDAYTGLEQREKVAIATALGETKTEKALQLLSGFFNAKGWIFGRGRQTELKLMAIIGLTAMGSVEAFNILNREILNRNNPKEVSEAALKAATRVKAGLTGGVGPEPEGTS